MSATATGTAWHAGSGTASGTDSVAPPSRNAAWQPYAVLPTRTLDDIFCEWFNPACIAYRS
jgi:hypothetical protein